MSEHWQWLTWMTRLVQPSSWVYMLVSCTPSSHWPVPAGWPYRGGRWGCGDLFGGAWSPSPLPWQTTEVDDELCRCGRCTGDEGWGRIMNDVEAPPGDGGEEDATRSRHVFNRGCICPVCFQSIVCLIINLLFSHIHQSCGSLMPSGKLILCIPPLL